MAIFYNHIKGCGRHATNTFSGSFPEGISEHKDVWSFIKFADILYVDKSDNTRLLTSVKNSPIIYLNAPNQPVKNITNECYSQDYEAPEQEADKLFTESNTFCLGHILTTNAKDQYVNKEFEFKNKVTINNLYMNTENSHSRFLDQHWYFGTQEEYSTGFINSSILNFSLENGVDYNQFEYPYLRMYLEKNDGTPPFYGFYINLFGGKKNLAPTLVFTAPSFNFREGDTTINCNLHVGSGSSDTTKGIIKADNKCEALYFNATSDRRAKTNIVPTEFSALPVVNSIPTYTFNYNNKKEKTIGLIAQEAAEFDLDGFNMVDNLEATGQDDDFMQMKESKLVYVL